MKTTRWIACLSAAAIAIALPVAFACDDHAKDGPAAPAAAPAVAGHPAIVATPSAETAGISVPECCKKKAAAAAATTASDPKAVPAVVGHGSAPVAKAEGADCDKPCPGPTGADAKGCPKKAATTAKGAPVAPEEDGAAAAPAAAPGTDH